MEITVGITTDQALADWVTARLVRIGGPPHPADMRPAQDAVTRGLWDDRLPLAFAAHPHPSWLSGLQKRAPDRDFSEAWTLWKSDFLTTEEDAWEVVKCHSVPDHILEVANAIIVLSA